MADRSENDLAINIRKATSIGKCHLSLVSLPVLDTHCAAEETAPKRMRYQRTSSGSHKKLMRFRKTCPSMYRLHMGPQVLTILLGWHESVRNRA